MGNWKICNASQTKATAWREINAGAFSVEKWRGRPAKKFVDRYVVKKKGRAWGILPWRSKRNFTYVVKNGFWFREIQCRTGSFCRKRYAKICLKRFSNRSECEIFSSSNSSPRADGLCRRVKLRDAISFKQHFAGFEIFQRRITRNV